MAGSKDAKRVIILDGKNQKKEDLGSGSLNKAGDSRRETYVNRTIPPGDLSAAVKDDEPLFDEDGIDERLPGAGAVRRNPGKKRLLFFLVVSAAILAVLIFVSAVTVNNNYVTPVKIYEKYLNKPEYTGKELSEAYGNRVAEKELKRLRELLCGYEDYNESLDASLLKSREIYNDNCERYGDDFYISVTVDSANRLSSVQTAALQTELNGILNDINASTLVQAGDPELRKAVNEVTQTLRQAGISGGYRLDCTQRVTGSAADGVSEHCEFTVVRLDGRWIMWDAIYDILKMSYR